MIITGNGENHGDRFGLGIAIGAGIGGLIGGGAAWYFTRKEEQKKAQHQVDLAKYRAYLDAVNDAIAGKLKKDMQPEDIVDEATEAIQIAYQQGIDQTMGEAQKWIDTYVTIQDGKLYTTAEGVQAFEKLKEDISVPHHEDRENIVVEVEEPTEKPVIREDSFNEPAAVTPVQMTAVGDFLVFTLRDGSEAKYPRAFFFDDAGNQRNELYIRMILKENEKNLGMLRKVFDALGWGDYRATDAFSSPVTDEELNHLEVLADADEGEIDPEEAEQKTKEREEYLKNVRMYRDNPNAMKGMITLISRKRFEEEHYLEASNIDYFDQDNTFIESTDANKVLNSVDYFGVTDGNEIFDRWERPKGDEEDNLDNDPDVVYVRNFAKNAVFEVTRYHAAYAGIQDGSAFVEDGKSDQIGRTEWV